MEEDFSELKNKAKKKFQEEVTGCMLADLKKVCEKEDIDFSYFVHQAKGLKECLDKVEKGEFCHGNYALEKIDNLQGIKEVSANYCKRVKENIIKPYEEKGK